MAITSSGYTFSFDNGDAPGALPATFTTKGNILHATWMMVSAVIFAVVGMTMMSDLHAEPFPESLIPYAPLLIGCGVFLAGLYAALLKIETTIDHGTITIRRRSWFKAREHVMALSDYPGVLRKRVTYNRNKQTHVAWLAALPHDDKSKRVVLGASNDEAEGRKLVEDCARLLDIPALEETADGFQARAPGDLDRSIAELAAAGKIDTTYKTGSAPAELGVERGSDMIVLNFLKAAIPLKLLVVVAGVGAAITVAILLEIIGSDMILVIPAIAAFGIAVFLFLTLGRMKARRQLILRRDRVVIASLSKDGKEPKIGAELMHDEIEGVRIAPAKYGGNALWFDTDRGSFPAGDNAPRAALDYAHSLVIAALATAQEGSETGGDQ
ncbi:MAG: hypothetical protein HOL02_03720 [Rhodospirillaceae bacterium]|jgi:hypothetical protein|nr:hypothetical protein [Rhodospirillaceae bacterium]MBT6509535.1 hypothetical protein [Rhodospirillaceae bacterium]MBT7612671.1 hypothetical protein [Rhodospirillaceae bacterium]MBT7645788.1 hypothetical protein [Rhodospirillaceae bacterium]